MFLLDSKRDNSIDHIIIWCGLRIIKGTVHEFLTPRMLVAQVGESDLMSLKNFDEVKIFHGSILIDSLYINGAHFRRFVEFVAHMQKKVIF